MLIEKFPKQKEFLKYLWQQKTKNIFLKNPDSVRGFSASKKKFEPIKTLTITHEQLHRTHPKRKQRPICIISYPTSRHLGDVQKS
jgi:hypothetical protein